jgi:uncharacterized protein (TIGR03083 family)
LVRRSLAVGETKYLFQTRVLLMRVDR